MRYCKLPLLINFAILCCFQLMAQQRFYPIQSFYKDRLFHQEVNAGDTLNPSATKIFRYSGSCFFPQTEKKTFSVDELVEKKERQKWVGRKIFKEHFFDIKGKNFRISIDPLINFSMGKDLKDNFTSYQYQNTRGIQIQGEIGKKFSFITNLRENQQRFIAYQTDYIRAHGEGYPQDSIYVIQNGSVPGAARTKPFKVGGFDFAYATGAISYAPIKQLSISFGNNMHFVGAGYRSLLLSDNSANSPYLQFSYKINKKLSGEVLYGQQLNLLRTLRNSTPEALYEKKGYTAHYFTYQPIPTLSLSFFEGTTWDRGDSARSRRVNGLYYNPIPIVNTAILGTQSKGSNTVLGLNILYTAPFNLAFYGQLAVNQTKTFHPAYQLGVRWSEPFEVKNLFLQIEWNSVPTGFYNSPSSRLNYSHNNLPLAHPFRSGFSENVIRANYEWKKIAINYQSTIYFTTYDTLNRQLGTSTYMLAQPTAGFKEKGTLILQQIEIAYRFNRSNNLQFFITAMYRKGFFNSYNNEVLYFGIGLRTNLNNQYFDF